jgi:cytoskeletal protein RodZ
MPSLGEEFRAAREARKLSLSDVSEQIHIRTVYLQSIEDENWSAISAPVYVRGFLRTYARFLAIDPERAIERYNSTLGSVEHVQTAVGSYRASDFEEPRKPSPLVWILGGVALLLVALVGFTYAQRSKQASSAPPVAAASPAADVAGAPAPGASAPASPPPGALPIAATAPVEGPGLARPNPASAAAGFTTATPTLSVRARSNSWMRVVVDGKPAFEGLVPAGSEKTFHGRVATIRAGNAGGVEVAVNGRDLGTLGAPGSVVERSFPLSQEQNGR